VRPRNWIGGGTLVPHNKKLRGRKRKPTRLKKLAGNPGKRPIALAPEPQGALLAAPEWLTAAQQAGWAYAISNAPPELLRRLDRAVLAIWVVAEDIHRQAALKVAEFGILTKSPEKQTPMQSPFLPILNKQAQIMLKAASEMGFTPASRARIDVGEQAAQRDKFSEYMSALARPPKHVH